MMQNNSSCKETFFETCCTVPAELEELWNWFCFEKGALGVETLAESSTEKTLRIFFENKPTGGAKKIFEDSDGKKGSITVVGIWSEKLNLLADAMVTGGDSPTGTPKQSLYDQIPGMDDEELSKWMFSYGASMTTNENGLSCLISTAFPVAYKGIF